jgi:peptide/nickel transport system substrate-binding protein
MKKVKAILSILLVLAMAFSLLACSKSTAGGNPEASAPPAAAGANGTASASSPAAANTAKTIDSITIGVSGLLGRFLAGLSPAESKTGCDGIFDSVWRVDPKTKQIFSDILESWTWTDDTTLVLKMKQNIMFNNGDNATADDLIFSYTNHKERGSNFTNLMPVLWDQCVATDKYTATFKFSKPYPDFPNTVIFLIDKAWSQKVGWDSQEWYNNPVGSGPYKVTEYVTDDHFTLQARDDYWNKDAGPIAVKQWIVKYYPDPSTMYMDLETGTIQLCDVDSQDYSRYLKQGGDGYKCSLLPAGVVTYFSFGYLDNQIWKDQKLREAIAACADWNEVGKIIYGDQYVPASSMAPKDSPQYFSPGTIKYDPDKAKQLLAEAGYGQDNPLKLTTFMMDTPQFKNFCESFQSYASKVGIQIDIQYGDVSSALAKWLDPSYVIDFGFLFNNLGSPTFSLYDGLNGTDMKPGVTFAYVDDPDYQRLMADLVVNKDQDQVMKDAKELQQLIFDKTLIIPISELQTALGYRTGTLSEQQIKDFCLAAGNYQIGRLGMASAWK